MKLYIEQKFFSIWGRYSVYQENGDVAYTVQGYPALGKKMVIRDQNNDEVGMLKQELLHLLPTFQVWRKGQKVGYVSCKFSENDNDALDVLMLALDISALKTAQKAAVASH